MVPALPKRRWAYAPGDPGQARRLAGRLGLSPLAGRLLLARGLGDPQEARRFLAPQLGDLADYGGLKGVEQALRVLLPFIEQGRTVGIAGDYDADGVCATALLVDFWRQLGAPVVWRLPHRLKDGYGFSPAAAQELAAAGAEAIVTVDCGIADFEGLARAQELGLPVVVTDHHQVPPGPLVKADALLNPHQEGCGFSSHLAGVGLAFYLAAALRAALRRGGFFGCQPEPNLRHSLDLVALGTMADVVPLKEQNRLLVSEGLKVLSEGRRLGLRALAQVARLRYPLDESDLAFGLAPRINAAGRLEHAAAALELVLCSDGQKADRLSQRLDRLNRSRRELQEQMLEQALEMLAADQDQASARCLVLSHPDWHRGVLGLLASRLVERLGRPALAFALHDGLATGSGRSLAGFHLQRALSSQAHLLMRYGGHALAAGATLAADNLPALARGLAAAADEQLPPLEEGLPLTLEARVELAELDPDFMAFLESLAPFGQGNPEPLLAAHGLRVQEARIIKDRHLKMRVLQQGRRLEALGWHLGHRFAEVGDQLDLAFVPVVSNFGGRHLELRIKDLRPSEG